MAWYKVATYHLIDALREIEVHMCWPENRVFELWEDGERLGEELSQETVPTYEEVLAHVSKGKKTLKVLDFVTNIPGKDKAYTEPMTDEEVIDYATNVLKPIRKTYWGMIYFNQINTGSLSDMKVTDIFTDPFIAKLSAGKMDVLCEIELTETDQPEESDYWGWLDAKDDYFSMVWPHKVLFDVCFPYGPDICVERGEGRIVRLKLKVVQKTLILEDGL